MKHVIIILIVWISWNNCSAQKHYLLPCFYSLHPIDSIMEKQVDALIDDGIDTIIAYRHWEYTNGFNGYGKIQYRLFGKTYEVYAKYSQRTLSTTVTQIRFIADSLDGIKFLFENGIDKFIEIPIPQTHLISHDGEHIMAVIISRNLVFCLTSNETSILLGDGISFVELIKKYRDPNHHGIRVTFGIKELNPVKKEKDYIFSGTPAEFEQKK